jgi:hypothetical protein
MDHITELDELNKEELLAVAKQFGTEVKRTISKKDLVARLEEDGVTPELVNAFGDGPAQLEEQKLELGLQPLKPGELEETAQPAEIDEEEDDLVLVRMTRTNRTYEVRGYRFTREHPYALVKEDDADYLIEVEGGFRATSPKEVKAYYS